MRRWSWMEPLRCGTLCWLDQAERRLAKVWCRWSYSPLEL